MIECKRNVNQHREEEEKKKGILNGRINIKESSAALRRLLVNVDCKFVIVVDFRPPRRRADVCPGINHAGIEPWDSSRVWFGIREEERESVE